MGANLMGQKSFLSSFPPNILSLTSTFNLTQTEVEFIYTKQIALRTVNTYVAVNEDAKVQSNVYYKNMKKTSF